MVDHQGSRAAATHDFGQFGQWADQLTELRDAIGEGTVTDDGSGRPILEFGDMFRYIQQDGSNPGQVMFGWLRTDDHGRVTQILTKTMPAQVAIAIARSLLAAQGRSAGMNTTPTTRTSPRTSTGEVYEAAFSTTGEHPQCGIALTRSLDEARQRLADMLLLIDPRRHVVADITRLLRDETVQTYNGATGDIFAQVNDNDRPVPYTVAARPLTPEAHTTTVICHRCRTHGPAGPDTDAPRVYDTAESAGWTVTGTDDLCPACQPPAERHPPSRRDPALPRPRLLAPIPGRPR